MAERDEALPGRSPIAAFAGNVVNKGRLSLLIVVFIILLVVGLRIVNGSSTDAFAIAGFIAANSLLGLLLGGMLTDFNDSKMQKGEMGKALRKVDSDVPVIVSTFVNITLCIVVIYVMFYFFAISAMTNRIASTEILPIDEKVLALSAVTIAAFGIFAVRYAAYVRMTKRLEIALKLPSKDRNRPLVEALREAVFRGEHLYEPPGNIFVTVGITATFMGLAVALVLLDLPSLLGQSVDGSSQQVDGVQQVGLAPDVTEEQRRERAMASLTTFVGCMGLALGMSMVGVMTAIVAQWLRGLGAARCTEELLEGADEFLEGKPNRRKRAGGSTAGIAPLGQTTQTRGQGGAMADVSVTPAARGSGTGAVAGAAAGSDRTKLSLEKTQIDGQD